VLTRTTYVALHEFNRSSPKNGHKPAAEVLTADVPPLPGAPSLAVSRLRLQCVEAVSFDVARGECVGLTGLAGSGKEVIADAVAGLRISSPARRSASTRRDSSRVRTGDQIGGFFSPESSLAQ
jgi:ribose transport system ATP-binding protein